MQEILSSLAVVCLLFYHLIVQIRIAHLVQLFVDRFVALQLGLRAMVYACSFEFVRSGKVAAVSLSIATVAICVHVRSRDLSGHLISVHCVVVHVTPLHLVLLFDLV